MMCLGRVYILGPLVQAREDVKQVATMAMLHTPKLRDGPFTLPLDNLKDPVQYYSTWVPGGTKKELPPGMQTIELWIGEVI